MKKYTEKDTQVRRSDLNEIIDRLNGLPRPNAPKGSAFVRVQNNTGYALPPFSILGVAGNSFSSSADFYSVNRNTGVILQGSVPSADSEVVITLESCAVGGIAACAASGIVPCRLDIQDTSHEYAVPDDTEKLQSAAVGDIRILSTVSSTGTLWGVVLLNHRKNRPSALIQSVPEFESPDTTEDVSNCMERDDESGIIVPSEITTKHIYGETTHAVSNPLQIPQNRPAILSEVYGLGTTAVSAGPMLQIPCTSAAERGDVLEYPQYSGALYVVQTSRPASTGSNLLNYATVLPLLPYGEAAPKCSVGEEPYVSLNGYDSYYYDSANRQMVRGYGPYWHRIDYSVWCYLENIVYSGHASTVNGTRTVDGIPLDIHPNPLNLPGLFAWDIYENDWITAEIHMHTHTVPTANLISAPVDFKPTTIMYFPCGGPPGRGWTLYDLPQAYRLSNPQIVVPSMNTTSGQSGDQKFEYIRTDPNASSTLAIIQCGNFYIKQASGF